MRKWLITTLLAVSFLIAGCENNVVTSDPILADDFINMENLDEYMFRDDVQYAFNRNDSYDFNPDQILSEHELERLFDRDKAIFLYADGCIRSGYLKDVLNHMGYERVYVLGGFYEYHGEHTVLGDGYYSIGNTFYNKYIDEDTDYTYYVYGTFDMGRKISEIRFDILDENNVSLRFQNYSGFDDFNAELTVFENFIISDIVTMNELHYSLTNMEESGYDNIDGFTWDIEDGIIQLILGLKS